MTQLNTPYPSTAYLTGFLRSRAVHAVQEDLALELVLQIFSQEGLGKVAACMPALKKADQSRPAKRERLADCKHTGDLLARRILARQCDWKRRHAVHVRCVSFLFSARMVADKKPKTYQRRVHVFSVGRFNQIFRPDAQHSLP